MNNPEIPKFCNKFSLNVNSKEVTLRFYYTPPGDNPEKVESILIETIVMPYDGAVPFCDFLKQLLDKNRPPESFFQR